MVSKNNSIYRFEHDTKAVPHYALKKLNVGVASVLLGTTVGLGLMTGVSHADTVTPTSAQPAATTAVTQNVATATTQTPQVQQAPDATMSNTQVPAQNVSATTTPAASTYVAPQANAYSAPQTQTVNTQGVAPAANYNAAALYGQSFAESQVPVNNNVYGQNLTQQAPAQGQGAGQTQQQGQGTGQNAAPVSSATGDVNAASKVETNDLDVTSATNAFRNATNQQDGGGVTNSQANDQKMEEWNVSVGYKFATEDYTGKNGITVYAVPSKNGADGADLTKVNIKVIDRTGHNELGVTASGNTVAGQPTVQFEREYDGTRDVDENDNAEIIKGNVKGHHYTVYLVTVPLQTNFGWQYQQPTTTFTAEVTLDHVNNGVTIDQSRDINDTVNIYEYRDHLKFHYISKDGKINKTVDGPTVTSTGGPVDLNYDIPQGYKLANSDQVSRVEFGPREDDPSKPAETHYGQDGWPDQPTSPNETLIEVPLDTAAVPSSWTGQFVDGDNNNAKVGDPTVIHGNSGDAHDVHMTVPDGYELVSGQSIPTSVTLLDKPATQTFTLRHKHARHNPGDPDADKYDLNDIITRTINVHNPQTNQVEPTKQTVHLTRSADEDLVTHKLTYTDWTTGNWDSFDAPSYPGFKSSRNNVPAQKVTHDDKDQTVDITYNHEKGSWTGQFIDTQNNNSPVGDPTILNGNDGDQAKPGMKIPDGYKLAPGQTIPDTITFTNGPVNVKIGLVHNTHVVHPGDPDAGQYVLTHDATRTINFTGLDGVQNAPKSEIQKAEVTRTATVDDVTHKVLSYTPWTKASWGAYTAPEVKGYTPTPGSLPEVDVNDQTKNTTATINYVKQTSWTGQFVDKDNNMSPVGDPTVITGDAGSKHDVSMKVPDNYELVPGQNIPGNITLAKDNVTDKIQLQHKHKTVKPGDPDADKYGVTKTITRTIIMHNPDGKNGQEVQTVNLARTADVDLVTGKATYTAWSEGDWPAFTAPTIKDYKANPTGVAAEHVTSDTKSTVVDIYYKNDQGTWTGHFVDNDEGGKTVGDPTVVTGESGTKQKVTMNIPDGYELAPGQTIPSEVTMTDGPQSATIGLVHKHEIVNAGDPDAKKYNLDLKKAVTRTIVFKGLDDKKDPVIQKVVLLRSADVDLVTKEAKYTDWSTDEWPQFAVPQVDGYTADKTSIDAAKVDGTTQDQIVAVNYTKNAQSQAPESQQPASQTPASQAPAADNGGQVQAPAANNGGVATVAQPETVSAPAAVQAVPQAATVAAPAMAVQQAAPAANNAGAARLPQTGNDKAAAMGAMALGLATLGLGAGLLGKRRFN